MHLVAAHKTKQNKNKANRMTEQKEQNKRKIS
jgi:hypothetical protein